MTDEQYDTARYMLDEAIDQWLKFNGLTSQQIGELDYSSIDDELNYLLERARSIKQ